MCTHTCCYARGVLLAVAHVPDAKSGFLLACAHATATTLGSWVLAFARVHGATVLPPKLIAFIGTHDQTRSVDACSRFLVFVALVQNMNTLG